MYVRMSIRIYAASRYSRLETETLLRYCRCCSLSHSKIRMRPYVYKRIGGWEYLCVSVYVCSAQLLRNVLREILNYRSFGGRENGYANSGFDNGGENDFAGKGGGDFVGDWAIILD